MRKRRLVAWIAGPLAVALLAAGCGGGGGAGGGSAQEGYVTVNNTEPKNPLVPGNTTENGGGNIIWRMYTGLVEYNSDDGAPYNAMAESIDTTDNQTFTIKLKPGWTFHDGSPVKAKNFVDAWNYNAYTPNGMETTSFFENIQGYQDVSSEDPDGENGPQKAPKPKTDKMSGLKVIDDTTMQVTLSKPSSIFPSTLGYGAFAPLPDSFFKDPKAFEQHPIGNGPFMFESRQVNTQIKLKTYDQYKGQDKPSIRGVVFKNYDELETAYQDVLSGNLDFLDVVPPSSLVGNKWKQDFGDRTLDRPNFLSTVINFPLYKQEYKNPDLRKAVSLAINREDIMKRIFNNARKPATGFVPEGMPGYEAGACGEWCKYDPQRAKELFAKSGFKGTLSITSNADGGHKEWAQAVCGSISNTLGVPCNYNPVPTFSQFGEMGTSKTHTSMFRMTWQADYPSAESFLDGLYRTNASSNYTGYDNPEFNAKLDQALNANTPQETNQMLREAEQLLVQDMPAVPLYNQNSQSVWSDRITNVKVDPYRYVDLTKVRLAQQ